MKLASVLALVVLAAPALPQAMQAAPAAPIVPNMRIFARAHESDYPRGCSQPVGVPLTAKVRVTVLSTGKPDDPRIEQSSGRPCHDDAAIAAVAAASFTPATDEDGKAIASTIVVPIEFPFHPFPTAAQRALAPRPIVIPEVETGPCKLRASAHATITMKVPADGVPTDFQLLRSSGDACLDRQAMKTVEGYRFAPAMKDGQPVASAITIVVDFQKF